MKYFAWQTYPKWHLSHTKTLNLDYELFDHYLCIGPFQFHWKSDLPVWLKQYIPYIKGHTTWS